MVIAAVVITIAGCAGGDTATSQDVGDAPAVAYEVEVSQVQSPRPARPEPPVPSEPEPGESESPEPEKPEVEPEIFWTRGTEYAYTLAWRVLPELEYNTIAQCNCGWFGAAEGRGQALDRITGLISDGDYHNGHGGHMSASWVFDIERGLFGHPGEFSDGLPFMVGVHPHHEFFESVTDPDLLRILNHEWGFENPRRFFSVESVDSSLREDMEWGDEGWRLTEDAFNGRFALMYNMELLTDFIFDEVVQPWSLTGPVLWNGNWGVINNEGYTVVPFVFEHIILIDERTAFAKYDGAYGILDLRHTLEALQSQ